jgi:hypothetical protein
VVGAGLAGLADGLGGDESRTTQGKRQNECKEKMAYH